MFVVASFLISFNFFGNGIGNPAPFDRFGGEAEPAPVNFGNGA